MREGTPNKAMVEAVSEEKYNMICCCMSICGTRPDSQEGREFMGRIKSRVEALKGNRPGSAVVQWSDLKLHLEGALQECLAFLEAH